MNLKLIAAIVGVISAFGIGLIIGIFGVNSKNKNSEYYDDLISQLDSTTGFNLYNKEVNKENIKKHLKYLTSIGHMAGTPGDKISADYVSNEWKSQGLDHVDTIDYDVFLDFPDDDKYNSFEILNSNNEVEKLYEIKEPTFDKELNYSAIPKPFLAYAKKGSVDSDELIYANYCLEDDFEHLKSNGISTNDKIVICKYGKVFRGNKIQIAEIYNAAGVILYDDPARSAPLIASDKIYPNGDFLPGEGTQRGSLYISDGDIQTPNYPSNEYAYRQEPNNKYIPDIPAQVIGYKYAYDLFKLIETNDNKVKDSDWIGEFNLTYTYGGKLKDGKKIRLNVYNERKVKKTYNVVGVIKGEIEPDRYILIGNHRDAWSFGALDPSSGTSVLLEVSRSLANLKNNNKWKPKRSICFLSWGAEEYGLIGSWEFVEEFKKKLGANAIAYFNLDVSMKGNYSYQAAASPLLFDFVFDVTKQIRVTPSESVFDRWLKNNPNEQKTEPDISPYLGAGSDHAAFAQLVGLPCVDQTYTKEKNDPLHKNLAGTYATYHSSYETFNLISKYLDPNFDTFRIIALISGELVRRLADSLILPFNCTRYAHVLNNEYAKFKKVHLDDFKSLNLSFYHIEEALNSFELNSRVFHKRINAIDRKKYHLIRLANEQLRNVERAFLDGPTGLKRRNYEHMIFSPSIFNNYGSDFFPSISDAFYNWKKNTALSESIEEIKLQLSIVTFAIQSASSILKESEDFSR